MTANLLNEEEYIAELNRQLVLHPAYEPGMAFMAHPPGATGGDVAGIAIAGFVWGRAYMEVSNSVAANFELGATQQVYRGFQRQVDH